MSTIPAQVESNRKFELHQKVVMTISVLYTEEQIIDEVSKLQLHVYQKAIEDLIATIKSYTPSIMTLLKGQTDTY